MKLYEFEGHRLLSRVGIESPFFVVCQNLEEVEEAKKRLKFPIVAKVQVLSGKRGKRGGVKVCTNSKQLLDFCKEKFGLDFPPSQNASDGHGDGEQVKFIELSQKEEINEELYASITYDTVLKIPFLLFSLKGGMDIEEVKVKNPEDIVRVDIDPFVGLAQKDLKKVTNDSNLSDFLIRMWDAFSRFDLRLLEINPIGKIGQEYKAIDAKAILDDNGQARQKDLDVLPKGSAGAIPTKRELEARKIDSEDYRGSAGSTYIEFDGDPDDPYGAGIAILASGGGASLLVMDAVSASGGSPANYTEYSGNPPREKVEKLTKIALSRDGLCGCLVAGAVANFTDIFETLAGFGDGLVAAHPKVDYPVVIRRGGPRQKEAYEYLTKLANKEGFDIHLFGPETPISVACQKMVDLSNEYKRKSQMANGKSAS